MFSATMSAETRALCKKFMQARRLPWGMEQWDSVQVGPFEPWPFILSDGIPSKTQDPHEIRVDEESKLTLHGLLQYYVKLTEKETMVAVAPRGWFR